MKLIQGLRQQGIWAIAAGIVPWVFACAAEVADGGTSQIGEAVEELVFEQPDADDGLVDKAATEYFEVAFNAPEVGGAATFLADGRFFCVLSHLQGSYHVRNAARVFTFEGQWFGRGVGRAICIRADSFNRGPGNWGSIMSGEQAATMNTDPTPDVRTPRECISGQRGGNWACNSLFLGDAFSFINGIAGEMQGIDLDGPNVGESVDIVQPNSALRSGTIRVRTHNGVLIGASHSLFVGDPANQRMVKLRGLNEVGREATGNITTPGTFTFSASATGSFQEVEMTRSDLSFCAFTFLSGDINGRTRITISERFKAVGQPNVWVLSVTAPDGSAKARARCMAYDQR
jgi:hypothetical protein